KKNHPGVRSDMPKGLIILKYDDRSGIDIKVKYPEDKTKIDDKTIMHIFNLHEFSKEPGIVSLTIGEINFVTYYSGSEKDYFFILMLNILENPEKYEKILTNMSNVILENLDRNNYLEMIPSLYKQMLEHPQKQKFNEINYNTNTDS
ncbi:MAG: hypothetical protein ACFE9Z_13050, partial [Promethearchaeota archaeon]